MSPPLSVWTTGRPVPAAERRSGTFFQMIRRGIGSAWEGELQDVDCCLDAAELPAPHEVAGVILTGSPARVQTRDPWMLKVEAALLGYRRANVPVLGICFGHQLMGMAFGGESGPNPRGREIGTVSLEHLAFDAILSEGGRAGETPSPYVGAIESVPKSTVVMTHLDSVLRLPPGAVRLARTELEENAAVRFGERMWGVQFHPEMDADIVGDYLESRQQEIVAEGLDYASIYDARVSSNYGAELLRRFARAC